MKYLFIMMPFFLCFACDDDDQLSSFCTDDHSSLEVIGEWNWIRSSGTFAGYTWTPENTGIQKRLLIDDSELHFFEDGTLVESTEYEIFESNVDLEDLDWSSYINYNNETRLIILDTCSLEFRDFLWTDGIWDFYERE